MRLRHLVSITVLALTPVACFEDPVPSGGSGDGDGDTTGDGDGDPSGDGDGDPSGDGDGDTPGDGDGDPSTGDGDGDTGDGDGDPDPDPELIVFDLYEIACSAQWLAALDAASEASLIVCNANDQGLGSAVAYPFFDIETNVAVEKALVVGPYQADNGVTTGTFSNLDVSTASKAVFRTGIACPKDAQSCDIQWQVSAKPTGMALPPLAIENGFEKFDGSADLTIEVDLSGFLGPADVTLGVLANNGQSSVDRAVWIHPRIVDAG